MKLTPEQRKERAQKAAQSRWEKEKTEVEVQKTDKENKEGMDILLDNEEAIFEKITEMALKGDRVAAKLAAEKLIEIRTKEKESQQVDVIEYVARIGADGQIIHDQREYTAQEYGEKLLRESK